MVGNTQLQPQNGNDGAEVSINPIALSGETDILVTTAKAYPRNLKQVLRNIDSLSTIDQETASECIYSLKRRGQHGDTMIEGMSIRFAEIVAQEWGNLRVFTREKSNDGRFVTVEGIAWDMEKNNAFSVEVKRRITDRNGRPYNDDMLMVTTNAAKSIAFRNAVQKIMPYAMLKGVIRRVRAAALGQGETPQQQWVNIRSYFQSINVSERQLLDYVDIETTDELTQDMIIAFKGLANAIHEGSASVADTFSAARQLAEGERQSKGNLGMVESAMARSNGGE